MPERHAEAVWEGNLKGGKGTVRFGEGAFEGPYTFLSRFEEGEGTNPEELLGAALAGCFSMALSADLERAGYAPERVHTSAEVSLEKQAAGWTVTRINLRTQATVPGIEEAVFLEVAEKAKGGCPISRALGAVEIMLDARLVN